MSQDPNVSIDQALEQEAARLSKQKKLVEEKIAQSQKELREVDRRLGHFKALLEDPLDAQSNTRKTVRNDAPSEAADDSDADPLEIAVDILRERAGEHIHYKDLASQVTERGGHLPGRDPAQTLVSRMVRDDRFVRPLRRGWYALRDDYPNAANVGARRNSKRRRK